jgi:hypothetical protein
LTEEHVLGTPPASLQLDEPELMTSTHLSVAAIDDEEEPGRQSAARATAAPTSLNDLTKDTTIEISYCQ